MSLPQSPKRESEWNTFWNRGSESYVFFSGKWQLKILLDVLTWAEEECDSTPPEWLGNSYKFPAHRWWRSTVSEPAPIVRMRRTTWLNNECVMNNDWITDWIIKNKYHALVTLSHSPSSLSSSLCQKVKQGGRVRENCSAKQKERRTKERIGVLSAVTISAGLWILRRGLSCTGVHLFWWCQCEQP